MLGGKYLLFKGNACLQPADRTRAIRRLVWRVSIACLFLYFSCNIICVAKLPSATTPMLQKKWRRKKLQIFFATSSVLQNFLPQQHPCCKNSEEKKICNIIYVAKGFCNIIFVAKDSATLPLLQWWGRCWTLDSSRSNGCRGGGSFKRIRRPTRSVALYLS